MTTLIPAEYWQSLTREIERLAEERWGNHIKFARQANVLNVVLVDNRPEIKVAYMEGFPLAVARLEDEPSAKVEISYDDIPLDVVGMHLRLGYSERNRTLYIGPVHVFPVETWARDGRERLRLGPHSAIPRWLYRIVRYFENRKPAPRKDE